MRAERLYVCWRGQKGWPIRLSLSINTYYISTSKTRFLRSFLFSGTERFDNSLCDDASAGGDSLHRPSRWWRLWQARETSISPREPKREKYLSEQFTGRVEKIKKGLRPKKRPARTSRQVSSTIHRGVGRRLRHTIYDCPPTSNEFISTWTVPPVHLRIPGAPARNEDRHTTASADPFISFWATQ